MDNEKIEEQLVELLSGKLNDIVDWDYERFKLDDEITYSIAKYGITLLSGSRYLEQNFYPLSSNAQSFNIVKHLKLDVKYDNSLMLWVVSKSFYDGKQRHCSSTDIDLRKCICKVAVTYLKMLNELGE